MLLMVKMMVMVMMLVVKITWLVNSQSVMTPQEVSGPTNISGALRQNFAKYFNSFTKESIISTENHHQELKITQINIVIERNTVNSRINLSLTSSRLTRVRGKKQGWKADTWNMDPLSMIRIMRGRVMGVGETTQD